MTGSAAGLPVFVVTGTSGAGKGTLERALLAQMPELQLAVSATTRARRQGEEDGREYWFISDDDFDEKLRAGEFLEHVVFPWGQRSGTLRSEIARITSAGKIPLLDLETEGALNVKQTVPGAVTIFVEAPSFEENERRLRERATESEGEIDERLELARTQLSQADEFDHVIVNDDLDRALAELAGIVRKSLAAVSS
ncbi:MAG: guanylate kinase [Actinobacteria bacterium]|nr:MAG: guanylate kinase [Actinomycetota bacterium]